MKRALPSLGILAGGIAALLLGGVPARGVVLSNNLQQPIDGVEKVTTVRWLGSEFKTDDRVYVLDAVKLRLQQNLGGAVEASIYSDENGRPGKLIAVLGPSGAVGPTPTEVTFQGAGGSGGAGETFNDTVETALKFSRVPLPPGVKISGLPSGDFSGAADSRPDGVALAPNTTYWIVTRARSGQFASAYTDQEVGNGPGYTPTWAHSENAGGTWNPEQLSPLFLGVEANPDVVFLELRTDIPAILSAVGSALPMAMVQREVALSAMRDVTRDVNARLFRQRTRSHSADREELRGPASRFEFFAQGDYGSTDRDTHFPASGFESDVFAGTAGLEFHLTPELTLGAAISYVESDNALGLGIGDVKLNGEAFTTYIAFAEKGFYADALYSFGVFEHDIRRDTLFGKIARAEPSSYTHTFELNAGFNMDAGKFITGPFSTLTYVTGDLDSYVENGGGTANVHVAGQNFDSLVSRVGWQVSRLLDFGKVKVTPQVRVSWMHEFLDGAETVSLGLEQSPFSIGSGNRFTRIGRFDASSNTRRPGTDALELGVAFGIQVCEHFSVIVDYEARLWQADSFAHSVSLTGSLKF